MAVSGLWTACHDARGMYLPAGVRSQHVVELTSGREVVMG